jgi:hypothetical protein
LGWSAVRSDLSRHRRVTDRKESIVAMFAHEIRTREGSCSTHGRVTGEKRVAKLKFPFFVTGAVRGAAALRPYRCPSCGAKVS